MHPPRTSRGIPPARLVATCIATALALLLPNAAAWAVQPKQAVNELDQKAFFKPELTISSTDVPLASIQSRLSNQAAWDAFFQARAEASADPVHVFIDPRSGAVTNIIGSFPLIPGSGVGNHVTLASLSAAAGAKVTAVDADVVARVVRRFVMQHRDVLGIDVRQLGAFKVDHPNADLWQLSAPQVVAGVPVRYGRRLRLPGRPHHLRHHGARAAPGGRALRSPGPAEGRGLRGRRGRRLRPSPGLELRVPAGARAGELGGIGRRPHG